MSVFPLKSTEAIVNSSTTITQIHTIKILKTLWCCTLQKSLLYPRYMKENKQQPVPTKVVLHLVWVHLYLPFTSFSDKTYTPQSSQRKGGQKGSREGRSSSCFQTPIPTCALGSSPNLSIKPWVSRPPYLHPPFKRLACYLFHLEWMDCSGKDHIFPFFRVMKTPGPLSLSL